MTTVDTKLICFQCGYGGKGRWFCSPECKRAADGRATCCACGETCSRDTIPFRKSDGSRMSVCSQRCWERVLGWEET